MKKMVENSIYCNKGICDKCKDIIYSFHIHDYRTCKCGKSFIDGGTNYTRYGGDLKVLEYKLIDDFKIIREKFKWGKNYDVCGKILPKTLYITLKDMGIDHIKAVLDYYNFSDTFKSRHGLSQFTKDLFELEILYRKGKLKI